MDLSFFRIWKGENFGKKKLVMAFLNALLFSQQIVMCSFFYCSQPVEFCEIKRNKDCRSLD